MKERILFILAFLIIALGVTAGLLFLYNKSKTVKESITKIEEICSTLQSSQEEVTCKEAAQFALEAYPGKILSIEKKEVRISVTKNIENQPVNPETTPPPSLNIEVHTVWFISLEAIQPIALPQSTVKALDIAVDTKDKKILAIFAR